MASRNVAFAESIKAALGDKVVGITEAFGEVTLVVKPREIVPRIVRAENYADSEGFRKG